MFLKQSAAVVFFVFLIPGIYFFETKASEANYFLGSRRNKLYSQRQKNIFGSLPELKHKILFHFN